MYIYIIEWNQTLVPLRFLIVIPEECSTVVEHDQPNFSPCLIRADTAQADQKKLLEPWCSAEVDNCLLELVVGRPLWMLHYWWWLMSNDILCVYLCFIQMEEDVWHPAWHPDSGHGSSCANWRYRENSVNLKSSTGRGSPWRCGWTWKKGLESHTKYHGKHGLGGWIFSQLATFGARAPVHFWSGLAVFLPRGGQLDDTLQGG